MKNIYLFLTGVTLLFLTACNQPETMSFKVSEQELLTELSEGSYRVSPGEITQLLAQSSEKYRLIDVRSPVAYERDHLDGSLNIPLEYLLDAQYQDMFKEGDVVHILYGEHELQANGSWMILRQLGFENIKVLQGGYQYLAAGNMEADYMAEKPRFDYAAVYQSAIEKFKQEEEASRPKVKAAPAPVAKKIIPKKKKVVEEEEGC